MSDHARCPACGRRGAASFDPYFRRWRCFVCGWMPRSSVEVRTELDENPRTGAPLPPGAIPSAAALVPGRRYSFLLERVGGGWLAAAVRAFAGEASPPRRGPGGEAEPTRLVWPVAAPDPVAPLVGASRLEFTLHPRGWRWPGGASKPLVRFWDGGACDGWAEAERVFDAYALVPEAAPGDGLGGARRRRDDGLRRAFGGAPPPPRGGDDDEESLRYGRADKLP